MGLDMNLYKRTYVKNWEHTKPEERLTINIKRGGKPETNIKPERINYIEEEIGYWRKANAIHKWFIDNCADEGQDDNCVPISVEREQLEQLLKTCQEVVQKAVLVKGKVQNGSVMGEKDWEPIMEEGTLIQNDEEIASILPTTSGFFFGSTNYDEDYLQDVKQTIETIESALEEEGGDFYYEASW